MEYAKVDHCNILNEFYSSNIFFPDSGRILITCPWLDFSFKYC